MRLGKKKEEPPALQQKSDGYDPAYAATLTTPVDIIETATVAENATTAGCGDVDAICVRCLRLVGISDWLCNDHCCDECAAEMNRLAGAAKGPWAGPLTERQ